MTRVEKILTSHLSTDLPSIPQIAREVAMSESTLKRCFRLMYGTSMYDYYLQKKMEYAKVQLTEKKLPVKEVAYMLGYENPGSFIRIFKKHFRLPPGLMQKEDRKLLMKNKKM
jgi:AraC-like DNA-binding protein